MIAAGRATMLDGVIESLRPINEANDWELIARLDRIIDDETIPWERPRGAKVAVSLSRAWGAKTRGNPTYSFADFLHDFAAEGGYIGGGDEALSDSLEQFYKVHAEDGTPDYSAPTLK